jgi:hypothetical protein
MVNPNKKSDDKEDYILDRHLWFLDSLMHKNVTMDDKVLLLQNKYPSLTEEMAKFTLVYWMKTFTQRHKGRR